MASEQWPDPCSHTGHVRSDTLTAEAPSAPAMRLPRHRQRSEPPALTRLARPATTHSARESPVRRGTCGSSWTGGLGPGPSGAPGPRAEPAGHGSPGSRVRLRGPGGDARWEGRLLAPQDFRGPEAVRVARARAAGRPLRRGQRRREVGVCGGRGGLTGGSSDLPAGPRAQAHGSGQPGLEARGWREERSWPLGVARSWRPTRRPHGSRAPQPSGLRAPRGTGHHGREQRVSRQISGTRRRTGRQGEATCFGRRIRSSRDAGCVERPKAAPVSRACHSAHQLRTVGRGASLASEGPRDALAAGPTLGPPLPGPSACLVPRLFPRGPLIAERSGDRTGRPVHICLRRFGCLAICCTKVS